MKKLLLILLLGGCTTTVYKPINVYPELPPVQRPNKIQLKNCKYDLPRDKNNNPLKDSNIYVGYDLDNYLCDQYNDKATKKQIELHNHILNVIDKQRLEWIELNKKSPDKSE